MGKDCFEMMGDLSKQVFIAFDIESTGLHPVMHRMVELSAVMFTGAGHVLGEFDELINPGVPMPEAASKVNRLYDEDLRGKPEALEVLKKFGEFLAQEGGRAILLAHNAEFDVNFTGSEFLLGDLPLPENEIWDTLAISRARVRNIMNHKLSTLVHHFDLRADGFHRALVDSYHVMNLFLRLLKDSDSLEIMREFLKPYKFEQARGMFAVQLPLSLMGLKKSLSKQMGLKFTYESEPGTKISMAVKPHTLFRAEKHLYLYATRESGPHPESFRLDRVSFPQACENITEAS
jgi:DNA polymerase III subunit epsilon